MCVTSFLIQIQGSPITSVTSNSGSGQSEPSAGVLISEEYDSGINEASYAGQIAIQGNIKFLPRCP